MYPFAALADLKRHARTPRSDAFPHPRRTHERLGISVPRPQLEGTDGHNGQSGGRKRRQQGPIDASRGSYLSRLPSARRGGAEETRGTPLNVIVKVNVYTNRPTRIYTNAFTSIRTAMSH